MHDQPCMFDCLQRSKFVTSHSLTHLLDLCICVMGGGRKKNLQLGFLIVKIKLIVIYLSFICTVFTFTAASIKLIHF